MNETKRDLSQRKFTSARLFGCVPERLLSSGCRFQEQLTRLALPLQNPLKGKHRVGRLLAALAGIERDGELLQVGESERAREREKELSD